MSTIGKQFSAFKITKKKPKTQNKAERNRNFKRIE